MSVLAELRRPDSVVLTLRTLTPLYTGGVGQYGDQIHPSGLLGGIRRFSCLLAAAVGDATFEYAVWGTPTDARDRHAKQIALHADASTLRKIDDLPKRINWDRPDGIKRQGWFYNVAYEGDLNLTLTRRGISDPHWQLLLLALRIQIRHATLGAKDQFGLGVLATDTPPLVEPLTTLIGTPLSGCPGLHHAFFAQVQFDTPLPQSGSDRLEQGLRWREKLRGSLRKKDWDDLRHYVFGQLNRHGNAVNVSALYLRGNDCALRIWGVLPHTTPPRFIEQRSQVMQALLQDLNQGPPDGLAGTPRLIWQDGAEHQANLVQWINQLAGVAA